MKRAALLGSLLAVAVLVALWILLGGERRAGDARTDARAEPTSAQPEDAAALVAATAPAADERRPAARDEPMYVPDEVVASATRKPADEPVVHLHVRDARNGRELASVFVVEIERSLDPMLLRPGPLAERAEQEASSPVPLALPGPGEERTVFVRSPGFAWGRIDIGPHQHERTLDLEPGGDLRVRVRGTPRDPGTLVRVARLREAAMVELELHTADELLFQALPAGKLEVAAQIGTQHTRALAHEFVDLDAGSETRVTLVLDPVEPARWVPLAGTLLLPPEWGLDDFQLLFRLQGPALERWPGTALVDRVEMTIEDRQAGLFSWYTDDVQPGIYGVELPQLGYSSRIVVGVTGATDVRIAIAPPCAVRLRGVDALTREPAGYVDLLRGSGTEDWPLVLVPVSGWNVELSAFEFRAPCGELWITHSDSQRSSRFQLGNGLNELEYELPGLTPTGVRLSLLDGEGHVPLDLRRLPTLERLDGPRALPAGTVGEFESRPSWPARVSVDEHGLQLLVDGAGSYRLRVPELTGYRPVPERDLELRHGQLLELVIDLVPAR